MAGARAWRGAPEGLPQRVWLQDKLRSQSSDRVKLVKTDRTMHPVQTSGFKRLPFVSCGDIVRRSIDILQTPHHVPRSSRRPSIRRREHGALDFEALAFLSVVWLSPTTKNKWAELTHSEKKRKKQMHYMS